MLRLDFDLTYKKVLNNIPNLPYNIKTTMSGVVSGTEVSVHKILLLSRDMQEMGGRGGQGMGGWKGRSQV